MKMSLSPSFGRVARAITARSRAYSTAPDSTSRASPSQSGDRKSKRPDRQQRGPPSRGPPGNQYGLDSGTRRSGTMGSEFTEIRLPGTDWSFSKYKDNYPPPTRYSGLSPPLPMELGKGTVLPGRIAVGPRGDNSTNLRWASQSLAKRLRKHYGGAYQTIAGVRFRRDDKPPLDHSEPLKESVSKRDKLAYLEAIGGDYSRYITKRGNSQNRAGWENTAEEALNKLGTLPPQARSDVVTAIRNMMHPTPSK